MEIPQRPFPTQVDFPDQVDVLVHDPWRPVPALGGHAGVPAGSFDRGGLDCRTDVLTFTTDPLTAAAASGRNLCRPFLLPGQMRPALTSAPFLSRGITGWASHEPDPGPDLHLRLLLGNRRGLPQPASAREAGTDPPRLVEVPLQPTYFTLAAGHALRLSIAAACFPAYAVNPGTGNARRAQSLDRTAP